ncbi:hypothetical protein [Amycolatopsis sp. Poz14]|uniref:hypothetical protein n=1 Tax=Amycolatopsis sp. Poz14 TaxID=1447705 RepID=UPI001EE89129|nr:hypothetical protein [Amycolatopsis sp. Poz14]MCG3755845.1 hypothetical protein [Amycolatopsis sp. Poz14]
MYKAADLDEDAADLSMMRTERKCGEPIPEAALAAAARYVQRRYPKGRIPEQLIRDFPSQVNCPACRMETESSNTRCPHCDVPIYLHWTAGRDDNNEING